LQSAVAVDDTVAGEVMHSCRAEMVVRSHGSVAHDVRVDVLLCLDEIAQASCLKLRSEDLAYTPDAEKIDFGPPPIEACYRVAPVRPARWPRVTRFPGFAACSG